MFRKMDRVPHLAMEQDDVEDMYDPVLKMTDPLLEAAVPDGEPTLLQAVRYGDSLTVERELRSENDVNQTFDGAPYRVRSVAMVNGVSTSNYAALHLAVLHAPLAIVELLVRAGADVNICDGQMRTPLHLSVVVNRISVINYLLKQGADKNVRSSSGRTPLLAATLNDNLDCVRALLGAGADPDIMDIKGTSVLSALISRHFTDMGLLDLVIEAGCNVNIENSKGGTPLMFAGAMKKLNVMKRLVAAGADINKPDNNGCTVLHLMMSSRRTEQSALFLIHNGADLHTPDKKGVSVLKKAVNIGNAPMIKLLLSADCPNDCPDIMELPLIQRIFDYFPDFKEWMLRELNNPKTLKRTCRQCIRGILSPYKLNEVTSLDLPRMLQDFLLVREINVRS